MTMTIKHGGVGFSRQLWRRAEAKELGAVVVDEVTSRTFERGLDVSDRPFEPYSPEYARANPGRVDLSASGTLEASIKVQEATPDMIEVGPTGVARSYARHVNERRRFLGISPANRAAIAAAFRRLARSVLRRTRRRP